MMASTESHACMLQPGSADAMGQGKLRKLVPLSLEVQSLNGSVGPVRERQRMHQNPNRISFPSGTRSARPAPGASWGAGR